jgi:hypothetical protein
MCFKMSSHVSAFGEPLLTILALVWFLSCVSSDVYLEGTRAHKSRLTELTLERPFSRMASHVVSKMTLCRESFLTTLNWANKGLFPRMNAHVRLQITSLCEGLSAAIVWALKRLLSSLK